MTCPRVPRHPARLHTHCFLTRCAAPPLAPPPPQANTTLTSLSLQSCKFTERSAELLAAGLAANKGLTSLDLTMNQLGDEGARVSSCLPACLDGWGMEGARVSSCLPACLPGWLGHGRGMGE